MKTKIATLLLFCLSMAHLPASDEELSTAYLELIHPVATQLLAFEIGHPTGQPKPENETSNDTPCRICDWALCYCDF